MLLAKTLFVGTVSVSGPTAGISAANAMTYTYIYMHMYIHMYVRQADQYEYFVCCVVQSALTHSTKSVYNSEWQ